MGLLDNIKRDAQSLGKSSGKFFYVKDGDKRRIRFLHDLPDGIEFKWHSLFEQNVKVPCQSMYKRKCRYCDDDAIRTRNMYAWSVWDYDSSEVKIFMFMMNNCSPVGAIAAAYETYGTIVDRDFLIGVTGKATDKVYTVTPFDKSPFQNKAKALSKSEMLKMIDKAYPDTLSGNASEKSDEWDEDKYEGKSAPELYKMCVDRGIEAEKKQNKAYYVDLLEAEEEKTDEWGEEEEDESPSDVSKYLSMAAPELYKMCISRGIEVEPKKPVAYYANLLEDHDKATEDWGDNDDEWADV